MDEVTSQSVKMPRETDALAPTIRRKLSYGSLADSCDSDGDGDYHNEFVICCGQGRFRVRVTIHIGRSLFNLHHVDVVHI